MNSWGTIGIETQTKNEKNKCNLSLVVAPQWVEANLVTAIETIQNGTARSTRAVVESDASRIFLTGDSTTKQRIIRRRAVGGSLQEAS